MPKPRFRWPTGVGAAVCAGTIGISACNSEDDALGSALQMCESDAECSTDRSCNRGVCLSRERRNWVLDLEIRPAPSSNFVANQQRQVTVPALSEWAIVLPVPVIHQTTVVDAEGAFVDADLAFRPVDRIEDRPLDLSHRTLQGQPALVPLPTGVYDIRISPLDAARPPVEVEGFVVQPGEMLRRKELVLPERYRELRGEVRARVSVDQRLSGVEVFATGIETGLASTRAISDLDGRYAIALPSSKDTAFRLTAQLPDDLQPSWQFEQIVRVPMEEDREKAIELDLPAEVVRGNAELNVVGIGPQGPEPVADALVVLTASVASIVSGRSYQVSGRTDGEGNLRVRGEAVVPVLRGLYLASVEPPPRSRFARSTELLDLSAVRNTFTVEAQLALTPRVRVEGSVADADGARAERAQLTFEPVDSGTRAPTTETDENGRYSLDLDPGRYVLLVDPPVQASPTRSSPRHAVPIIVPGGLETFEVREVIIPLGIPVDGVVVSADGSRVPDVEVSLFDSIMGIRYLIGRAVTNELGEMRLFLPE